MAGVTNSTHVSLVGFHVLWLTVVTASVWSAKQLFIILHHPLKLLVYLIMFFNLLNAELNPIRHLLALVGARHIVHVSRIRVNYYRHGCFKNITGVNCPGRIGALNNISTFFPYNLFILVRDMAILYVTYIRGSYRKS